MKRLVLLVLILVSVQVNGEQTSFMENLRLVAPSVYEVVRDMEKSSDRDFSDDEIRLIMESKEFLRRIELKRNTDIDYVPCRLTGCRPA